MYRVFVAIDVPPAHHEALAGVTGGVPGARWVEEGHHHLTLRFVGTVDGAQLDDLAQGLGEIRVAPLTLALKGVGHFPPRQEPKILWAGVQASEGLGRLRHAIDRVAVRCGLAPDRRKFHPHVTLARLRGSPSERVARFLVLHALFATPPFEVDAFHLYESTLFPDGPSYAKLESYPLYEDP